MGAPPDLRRPLVLAPLLFVLAALGFAAGVSANAVRDRGAPISLFAGAGIGDFPVGYAAPGAIAEVPDPVGSGETVLRMTVSNRDVYPLTPTDNPRAELASPEMIGAGANVWLSTKFLVPAGYPEIDAGGWVTLVSVYGRPFYGTSPWRLELAGDSLQWQRNATYDFDTPFRQPLARGRWTTVLLHERFDRRGFVEMWIDGRPIEFFGYGRRERDDPAATRRLKMATMDRSNDGGPNSVRISQYREEGMFAKGTIYFGALEVGPTRGSVAP
jgi:hypothetical protein